MNAAPLAAACVAAGVVVIGVAARPRHPSRQVAVEHAAPRRRRATNSDQVAVGRIARLFVIGAAGFVVAGPFAAAIVFALAGVWPRRQRSRSIARQQRTAAAAYPDAIDLVVLGVRAGLLPSAALAAATEYVPGPVRPAFAAVAARVQRGERFADALDELETVIGADARPLIDSFAAAERYGLPLAPVLERLATEARQQRRRVADTAARQLPVRLSLPLVLCTLPSFVLLAIVPLLLGAFSSLHTP